MQRCPMLGPGRPVQSALDSGLAPRGGPHGVSKTRYGFNAVPALGTQAEPGRDVYTRILFIYFQ